uniref:Uncharacterized protein n=1 Tax=Melopsittacus undulatus TaxID=13146 RepID=A0A8V5GVM6_MELUD
PAGGSSGAWASVPVLYLSSQCRSLSTKAGSRSVLAALVSMAKRLTGRYERFLELTFPRFYVLHSTFTRGGCWGGQDVIQ